MRLLCECSLFCEDPPRLIEHHNLLEVETGIFADDPLEVVLHWQREPPPVHILVVVHDELKTVLGHHGKHDPGVPEYTILNTVFEQ